MKRIKVYSGTPTTTITGAVAPSEEDRAVALSTTTYTNLLNAAQRVAEEALGKKMGIVSISILGFEIKEKEE